MNATNYNHNIETLIANAVLQRQKPTIARRFNGAVAGCPELFQIKVFGEFHGWFDTRAEAKAAIKAGRCLAEGGAK